MLALIVFGSSGVLQANATTLVSLTYTGGSTAETGTGGTGIDANMGDTLAFRVNVQVDAAGISGLGFDLQWIDNADLISSAASWETGTLVISQTPSVSVELLVPSFPMIDSGTGQIRNIGWFIVQPAIAPTNTNVFLGTISFHVESTQAASLAAGFFGTDGFSSALNAAGTFITPDFESFSVNAPAPGAAPSLLAGLLTLAAVALGRRHRR